MDVGVSNNDDGKSSGEGLSDLGAEVVMNEGE